MNKMNFVATAVALSALCLAGCSNDAEEPGTEPQPGRQVIMTMQASTAEPQTRADYTESDNNVMRFSWREKDAISVYVDGNYSGPGASQLNRNCELTTTDAGKSVTFSGTAEAWSGTRNIYAVYPYKESEEGGIVGYDIYNPETLSDAEVYLTLANPQEFTVGGAFTNGFLVGAGTATVGDGQIKVSPVSMKQVMSFVRFNITEAPGNVTQVTMAGKKSDATSPNNIFPTQATVYMSTGEITEAGTGGYKTELTMNVTDDTGPGDKSVSFALWPADYSDVKITITITFEDGKVITLEKDGMEFERNVHYVVDVDAKDAAKPVSVWDGSIGTQPAGYDTAIPGTVDITSAAELAWLAKECNDGGKTFEGYTFNLTTDIDLNKHKWTPIGFSIDKNFKGNFNGQGHTVRNMEVDISVEGDFFAGFFGFIYGTETNPTKVSNLIVEGNVNAVFTGGTGYAGGICGSAAYVEIEFCRFNGTVSGSSDQNPVNSGGIAGSYGVDEKHSLTCCISDAKVTVGGQAKSKYKGGLVGSLSYSYVTNSAWNSIQTEKGVDLEQSDTFDETNNSFTDITGLNELLGKINGSKSDREYEWKAGDNANAYPILVKYSSSGTN